MREDLLKRLNCRKRRNLLRILRPAISLWLVLFLLLQMTAEVLFYLPVQEVQAAGWYNTGWGYRKKITIDHTKVNADLTNFAILYKVTDPDLKDTNHNGHVAQSDGGDILFTKSDGTTKLDHEIEKYSSSTGELTAWVEIDSLSSTTDTEIYIYYGNSTCSDQWNTNGTWESSLKMVQHLEESPANGAAGHIDSTSNSNDGTPYNFDGTPTSTTDGTGQIDGADSFDGDNDYVDCGNFLDFSSTNFTISLWICDNNPTANTAFIAKWGGGAGNREFVFEKENSKLKWVISDGTTYPILYGNTVLSANVWYHIAVVNDWDNDEAILYLNGNQDAIDTEWTSSMNSYTTSVKIGTRTLDNYFDGTIDEVRIYNRALSAEEISTQYNNQNSPSTFYSMGSEEPLPSIQFTSASSSGTEAISPAQLELTLSATSSTDVSVDYAVSGGTATGGGVDYTLATGTVTIIAGNTTTTIDISIVDDSIDESDETIEVTISNPVNAKLGTNATHTYTIQDNDTAGVTITESVGSTDVTEGGATDTYDVVLTSQPTADVTITINPDAQVTTTPSSLTFTSLNWNSAQTVTVSAVDDDVVEGNHTGTITHSVSSTDSNYDGISISNVVANITDNDAAGITVSPTSGLTTTEAGGTSTFTVVLTSEPTADVTIGLSSSDATEGTVSPSSLTFTPANWNTAQTVTVTGVDDDVVDGDITYTIVTAPASSTDPNYNNLDADDVSVTNTDNDEPAPSGGGGMPSAWFNPPKAPEQGFKVLINQGDKCTDNPKVTLNLFGGPDTARMAISNNPEFSGTGSTGQIAYQSSYQWNLCQGRKSCPEGEYIVYVKFYTQYGQPSQVVSGSIVYQKGIMEEGQIEKMTIVELKEKIAEIKAKIVELRLWLIKLLEKRISEIQLKINEIKPNRVG